MNSQLIKRSSGWEPADAEMMRDAYTKVQSTISSGSPAFTVHMHDVIAPTWAEHFGLFVRETFSFYTQVLTSIKNSPSWIVLRVHTTTHSRSHTVSTLTLETEAAGQVGIQGYIFTPAVFNFSWEDNTLDRPWTPWGWEIPILSNDADDDHFFYDPTTRRVIAHRGENLAEIGFYGFEAIELPELSFFKAR